MARHPPVDDRARLQAMFDSHHELVWRTLRRYGLDPEAAADVGQQAYVVAIERIVDIWQGSERLWEGGVTVASTKSARIDWSPSLPVQPTGEIQ